MNYIGKSWRESASLIALSRKTVTAEVPVSRRADVNFDILLQTRTQSASFANSVVFPGGVCETADAADSWIRLLTSFGYSQRDLDTLHRAGATLSPIFKDNPVQSHISLRITAIRETFEELGLLICSRDQKKDRSGLYASFLADFDIKHWQDRVSKNPGEFLTLCKEAGCYPDLWSLHYWSSWLTPVSFPKRFSAAFFVTALESRPSLLGNSEVTKVEWASPSEVLHRDDVVLYPPQVYELNRISCVSDCDQLITFAKGRSGYGHPLNFPVVLQATDGILHLLPGDDLYPTSVDYENKTIKSVDKSLAELRDGCSTLHRFEDPEHAEQRFILRNYNQEHHINMGDCTINSKVMIH